MAGTIRYLGIVGLVLEDIPQIVITSIFTKDSPEFAGVSSLVVSGFNFVFTLVLYSVTLARDCKRRRDSERLLEAAGSNDLRRIKWLLGNTGADINYTDAHDETPLHVSAHKGHVGVVECLLGNENIEANKVDANGCTSLYAAARSG
eukprot:562316_1